MQMGRRVAFDYGDVRIGVAICDREAIIASPLVTLNSKSPTLFNQITQIIEENSPVALYVGEPLNLSGDASTSALKAAAFADKLRVKYQLPVTMIDERLTTVTALANMRAVGITGKSARAKIDMAAAVSILEQALLIERSSNGE
jgi:putative Holliday junction resolvase